MDLLEHVHTKAEKKKAKFLGHCIRSQKRKRPKTNKQASEQQTKSDVFAGTKVIYAT